jgi:hypothetical protein
MVPNKLLVAAATPAGNAGDLVFFFRSGYTSHKPLGRSGEQLRFSVRWP